MNEFEQSTNTWSVHPDPVPYPIMTIGARDNPILTIHGKNGSAMVTIERDGSIVFGPDYTPDEAARIFWEAIGKAMPR